jgi:hypothetical protein
MVSFLTALQFRPMAAILHDIGIESFLKVADGQFCEAGYRPWRRGPWLRRCRGPARIRARGVGSGSSNYFGCITTACQRGHPRDRAAAPRQSLAAAVIWPANESCPPMGKAGAWLARPARASRRRRARRAVDVGSGPPACGRGSRSPTCSPAGIVTGTLTQ